MWNPFWFKTKKRENLRSCPPSAEKRRLPLEGARPSRLSTRYGSEPFIFKRTSHMLGQLKWILFKMKFSSFVSPLRVRLSRWICWPAMYFSGWTLFFCFWPWSNVFFFKIQFEEKVKCFFFAYRGYRPVSFYLHKGTFLFISFPKESFSFGAMEVNWSRPSAYRWRKEILKFGLIDTCTGFSFWIRSASYWQGFALPLFSPKL